MRRTVSQIVVAFAATLISFMCYISPFQAIILSSEQMNELLLAILGAGISILATELIEYRYLCNRLENNILNNAERVISAFQGMRSAIVESLPYKDEDETYDMLHAYYEEEWNNLHPNALLSPQHSARDKIITLIENCDPKECDRIAEDSSSHFRRYISRVQDSIYEAYKSYQFCFDNNFSPFEPLLNDIGSISYLPIRKFWQSRPFQLTSKGKRESLDKIRHIIEDALVELKEAIVACRLFEKDNCSVAKLFESLHKAEKRWNVTQIRNCNNKSYVVDNTYAIALFDATSEFAKYSSSKSAGHYFGAPWWAIENKSRSDKERGC